MSSNHNEQFRGIAEPAAALGSSRDIIAAKSIPVNRHALAVFQNTHLGWAMNNVPWRTASGTLLIELNDGPTVWLDVISGDSGSSQVLEASLFGNRISHGYRTAVGGAPTMLLRFFDYYGNTLFDAPMDPFDVACSANIPYISKQRVTSDKFGKVHHPEIHGGAFNAIKCP